MKKINMMNKLNRYILINDNSLNEIIDINMRINAIQNKILNNTFTSFELFDQNDIISKKVNDSTMCGRRSRMSSGLDSEDYSTMCGRRSRMSSGLDSEDTSQPGAGDVSRTSPGWNPETQVVGFRKSPTMYERRKSHVTLLESERENAKESDIYFKIYNKIEYFNCPVCYENILKGSSKEAKSKKICEHNLCNLCYINWEKTCVKNLIPTTCPICRESYFMEK